MLCLLKRNATRGNTYDKWAGLDSAEAQEFVFRSKTVGSQNVSLKLHPNVALPRHCLNFRRHTVIPMKSSPQVDEEEDRRKFLADCGRFTAVAPPTITVLF